MTEFKITGPGLYKTRSGEKAVVERESNYSYEGYIYQWKGRIGDSGKTWNRLGIYLVDFESSEDIIGPWEESAAITTVLEYAGITKKPSDTLTWLDFVQVMHTLNDPASVLAISPKAEKQSEDEAHGNTACAEAGSDLKCAIAKGKCVVAATKGLCSLEEETEIVTNKLKEQGFTIVRTDSLRHGVYNTRTDKETD